MLAGELLPAWLGIALAVALPLLPAVGLVVADSLEREPAPTVRPAARLPLDPIDRLRELYAADAISLPRLELELGRLLELERVTDTDERARLLFARRPLDAGAAAERWRAIVLPGGAGGGDSSRRRSTGDFRADLDLPRSPTFDLAKIRARDARRRKRRGA